MPFTTFSIELLPAPFGPMMARISCSSTSKLTPDSAFTPPKASEMSSTARITPPTARATLPGSNSRRFIRATSRGRPRLLGGERLRGIHLEIGADHSAAPVLEAHLGLDHAVVGPGVEGIDDGGG